MQNSIFNSYKTNLPIKEEIRFQADKSNSPFSFDSGTDYDLRGFWQKYGNLNPQATNGHLTDEFKLPNHITYSNESKFYQGEPYAVNWGDKLWQKLSNYGVY